VKWRHLLKILAISGILCLASGQVAAGTTPAHTAAMLAAGTEALATSTVHTRSSSLRGAQHAFSIAFSQLIVYAQTKGYQVSLGECYRPWGPRKSLHKLKLACDINLFHHGNYLRRTESYRPLGEWWLKYGQNYGLPLEWGGSHTRSDGNHFSYGWQGRW